MKLARILNLIFLILGVVFLSPYSIASASDTGTRLNQTQGSPDDELGDFPNSQRSPASEAASPPSQATSQGRQADGTGRGADALNEEQKRLKLLADQRAKERAEQARLAEEAAAKKAADDHKRLQELQAKGQPAPLAVKQAASRSLSDLERAQEASNQIKKGKTLKKEDFEKVFNPDVRKHLLQAVESDEEVRQLKKEDDNLTKSIASLLQVAATAVQRSQGMQSLPTANGRTPAALPESGGETKRSSIRAGSHAEGEGNISSMEVDKQITARLEAALAKAEAEEKAAGKTLTPEQKSALREKIRTSLRNQLVAAYKAKVADAALNNASAYSPEGQLKREAAPSANEENADANHGLSDVIGSTFSAYQNNAQQAQEPGFSMAASDTQSAVDGIIEQSSRDLASDAAAGVLAEDTPDLFLRVREAHQRAIKRSLLKTES